MLPTTHQDIRSDFLSLEKRLERAERSLKLYKAAWALLAVLILLLFRSNSTGVVHAQPSTSDRLRLRELDIIDEKGRERIVIAAPIPEPLVNGKTGHRVREVSAAVQFKAQDGTEQGGIAMSNDGSMIVGIDDEHGQERAHLYYLPTRGSGVYLQGEKGKGTVSLLLPNGGSGGLEVIDASGKVIAVLPLKSK
jgi:hypothetical protein